jgi:hypothetical protein
MDPRRVYNDDTRTIKPTTDTDDNIIYQDLGDSFELDSDGDEVQEYESEEDSLDEVDVGTYLRSHSNISPPIQLNHSTSPDTHSPLKRSCATRNEAHHTQRTEHNEKQHENNKEHQRGIIKLRDEVSDLILNGDNMKHGKELDCV